MGTKTNRTEIIEVHEGDCPMAIAHILKELEENEKEEKVVELSKVVDHSVCKATSELKDAANVIRQYVRIGYVDVLRSVQDPSTCVLGLRLCRQEDKEEGELLEEKKINNGIKRIIRRRKVSSKNNTCRCCFCSIF